MNSAHIITAITILIAIVGGIIVWEQFTSPAASKARKAPREKAEMPVTESANIPETQGVPRIDPDFPPKPKWKPTVPMDIPKTIQTFAYYTDHKRAFAVFTHGTCVLLPEGSQDAEKDAKQILDDVYNWHPDFNTQTMDDGNFMVSYSQPAYSIVFEKEFEANRDYINRNHLDGVVRSEVLLNAKGEPNTFDDIAKIGLFGRARMFLDAQAPVIVRIYRPQP
jgi:hypothetical protein